MDHIERELALLHVNAPDGVTRQEILNLVEIFHGRILSVSESAMTIETTGEGTKVDALLQLLDDFGIRELVRTAPLVIRRLPTESTTDEREQR